MTAKPTQSPSFDGAAGSAEMRLCVDHKIELWKRGYGTSEALALIPSASPKNCSVCTHYRNQSPSGDFYNGIEWLACWLLDNAEGETITEEQLRPWAAKAWAAHLEQPNSGMNESPSHQPSMTSEQLDRFQDWLNREAVEADKRIGAYFNGRACAFNDAFECFAILRMKASQTPESTESDKSPNASPSATPNEGGSHGS